VICMAADTKPFIDGLHAAAKAVREFGLRCRKCGGRTRVRHTIPIDDGVRRYRVCLECGKKRRTEER
jgi:hypothetical protein